MSIRYEVNDKEGKITAFIDDCKYDAINKINKMLRANGNLFQIDKNDYRFKNYLMNDVYSGTVKVHGEDIFDEKIGKELAKDKVIRNYKTSLWFKISDICDILFTNSRKFDKWLDKHEYWLE